MPDARKPVPIKLDLHEWLKRIRAANGPSLQAITDTALRTYLGMAYPQHDPARDKGVE